MIAGHATPAGTGRFRDRHRKRVAAGHFRRLGGLELSSIGLGTYLGEADDATDGGYEDAVRAALERGVNVFDTAINYRHQRSERAIGRALARAIDAGLVRRDEIFVSSKAGFVPFDGEVPADPRRYLEETYLETGILEPDELAAGAHALAPRFLADQLARSRTNLGLETVDLYYLHNPETQFEHLPRAAARERLATALAALERAARVGHAGCYGVATWQGLRSAPGAPGHLDLADLVELAAAAAPDARSRFAAVQLPLNLAMPEALAAPTQRIDDATVPALVAARRLGLGVFASASILQGRLAGPLPPEIRQAFADARTDAQCALEFTRSAPGLTTALVGMANRLHVAENLELAAREPAAAAVYRRLF